MNHVGQMHYLFAVWMAGGNVSIFQNMKEKIKEVTDVQSTWLPVELFPKDFIANIPPISLNGAVKNSLVAGKRIHKLEKQSDSSFNAAYYFQHTYITFLWGLRKRVPFILAMDGVPTWYAKNEFWYAHPYFKPDSPVAKIKHAMTRRIYQQAFHLLPLSNGVKECLIEDYQIPESKITVIPPGVDIKKWICPERLPEQKGMGGKPLRVLFVGADFERKGGDLVAAIAMRDEFRNVEFHFVTKKFKGEKNSNIFIYDNISINSQPLMELYRSADVFISPTRADNHSVATIEAMAIGLPVISTKMGGISDVVVDGHTGYFVPKDDADAIADRLRKLIASPETRIAMGVNSRKRVETHFNIDRHVEIILELLKNAARNEFSGYPLVHSLPAFSTVS